MLKGQCDDVLFICYVVLKPSTTNLFCLMFTIYRKYLIGENFGEPYRLKLLARKNLANKLQSVHIPLMYL